MVGSPTDQEGSLEALLVQSGGAAEGGDRGPDAHSLREVDEQVGRPRVDLPVVLRGDHVAVVALIGLAHGPILVEPSVAPRCPAAPVPYGILRRMLDRQADPRTEDTIVFDLLSTPRGAAEPQVVGRATFRGGRSSVEAPDSIRIAVEELLGRAFVDRVQADERPRGYRRSGRGMVDFLVPGMAEHFIARLRGLWLSYPDGAVVTAREAAVGGSTAVALPEVFDSGPPVTDPSVRRATLATSDQTLNARPLVRPHPPPTGLRPAPVARGTGPVRRTDCGWVV